MDLSIIIVNYNTAPLLVNTIESVVKNTKNIDYEIIIVDNGSSDNSQTIIKDQYPDILLVENKYNLGFSKANNIGIKCSKGKYVLLLNSDTIVQGNCLEECIGYMEKNSDIGALGCKLILGNGVLDHACRRGFPSPEASLYYMLKLDKLFPGNKKYGSYTMNYLSENEINEVDSLTGAFMIVRHDIIYEVGILDEDFFMYGEDIDWCYRIKEAGWKVVYYPEAQIIHLKGQSSKKKKYKTLFEFHRAMFLFYNKHYIRKYNVFVTLFVYLGIAIKLCCSFILNLFRK